MSGSEQTYFQKGFNLKAQVRPVLAQSYHSKVVDRLKELGYAARAGEVRVKLAREFGFCYGVDRAVEYAYEARERFPDRRIFLSGEIIHNPEVNGRIEALGIRILPDHRSPEDRYAGVEATDVVILPAFGVPVGELQHLRSKGCVLVDTTCGSVLNVWKNVHRYARDGFTSVIHGKHYHEETKATASQALTHPGGHYLCVKDRPEAEVVCEFIRGNVPAADLLQRFREATSPGFDPERDLQKIGLANQTTMLMTESLEIQERLRARRAGPLGRGGAPRALPGLRHDLLRHPGPAGRGAEDAGRGRARRDGGDRRLQQQQHAGPGADLRAAAPDLPHQRRRPDPGPDHPPPAGRGARGDGHRELAPGGAGDGRPHRRRLDPEQRGGRGGRADPRPAGPDDGRAGGRVSRGPARAP